MKKILFIFIVFVNTQLQAQTYKTKSIIVITLDGYRWQELFTGADSSLMKGKDPHDDMSGLKSAFWNDDVNKRRKMLMPFFWGEIVSKGQLLGNRLKGSNVNLTNKYWFSYPGYNEIFTGFGDDSVNSNDKKYNKNITVFEVANKTDNYKNKVAAIASWDCFPYILNNTRSGIYVNAANQHSEGNISGNEKLLNDITDNMEIYSEGVRYDIFTYYYTLEYLKKNNPRLLFMGFDETDDFAHMGMYDRYLMTAHQDDKVIGELWNWLQSQPQYRDQTTLIITCDHGRGVSENSQWRHHGAKIVGADQTWIAIMGPDTPAKGEITSGQYYTNQIAKTIALLLNFDYNNPKAGKPLTEAFSK
jgi:hypothetical protein